MVPTNDVSKLFTMLYVLLGLVVIFSYVNYFAESMLLYAEDQAIKLAEKSNKRKRARQGGDAGDMRDVEVSVYVCGISCSTFVRISLTLFLIPFIDDREFRTRNIGGK
jgi:hypothetical protein